MTESRIPGMTPKPRPISQASNDRGVLVGVTGRLAPCRYGWRGSSLRTCHRTARAVPLRLAGFVSAYVSPDGSRRAARVGGFCLRFGCSSAEADRHPAVAGVDQGRLEDSAAKVLGLDR
jgi:hypothetical protein